MPSTRAATVVGRGKRSRRQHSQIGLALTYGNRGDNPIARRERFAQEIADYARSLLSVVDVGTRQYRRLEAIAAGLYKHVAWDALVDAAALSPEPYRLESLIAGEVIRRLPHNVDDVSAHDAAIAEAKEQGEGDVAVALWARDRTPQAAEVAERELREHAKAAVTAADALAREAK